MTAPAPQPLYLDAGSLSVFAMLHEPAEGRADGLGVLLCPPFGWDDVCSYRARLDWANVLAASGHSALRFDLPGSGDSEGYPRDPDRVDAWVAAVCAGARGLRDLAGCGSVAAVGIGLSGMVVVRAVGEGAPIDDLVLWSVPARGKRAVRELRAFAGMQGSVDGPRPESACVPEGGIEAGGFLLAPETVSELSALDLTAVALEPGTPRRALLLDRDGMDVDAALAERLETAGTAVTVAPGPGYAEMMDHPQATAPPVEVFATVGAWLGDRVPAPSRTAARPPVRTTVELEASGRRIRETPVTAAGPHGRLHGILTEPVDTPVAGVCAVIPGAGALRRIGPGRMWVELARRWAARGVPSLRVDLEGIGDTAGREEVYRDTGALYVDRLVDQTVQILDALSERSVPQRFLMLGLCSGAFWAFQTALRDERVTAVFALNPGALFWDDLLPSARELRRAREGLQASTWARVMRGEVRASRVLDIGRSALAAPFHARRQAAADARREREVEHALDRLRDTDKRVLFVFGEREPVYAELELGGLLAQLERWPNLEIEHVPFRDHSFESIHSQILVHELVDRGLERVLAEDADESAPEPGTVGEPGQNGHVETEGRRSAPRPPAESAPA